MTALHTHRAPTTAEAGQPPPGGPVMLDIGGDVGALIVRLDPASAGTELHVRPEGDTRSTHTGVWERSLGARSVVVAVFAALTEGVYAILGDDGTAIRHVAVTGGRVAEVDLRSL
jgi:hypothetical protein